MLVEAGRSVDVSCIDIPTGLTVTTTLDGPDPEPEPTPITPAGPTFTPSGVCGVEGTVTVPDQEGVDYTVERAGPKVTVTATPATGFTFTPDAVTQWTFDVSGSDCDEPQPKLPITGFSALLPAIAIAVALAGAAAFAASRTRLGRPVD